MAREIMASWLEGRVLAAPGRELPDAIVCGNDQMAIGAIRELHRTAWHGGELQPKLQPAGASRQEGGSMR
jgi:ABC-type sugar transport system substrate-binding protein